MMHDVPLFVTAMPLRVDLVVSAVGGFGFGEVASTPSALTANQHQ